MEPATQKATDNPVYFLVFFLWHCSFDYYQFCLLQADVFSYGIILCEIIGRVPADPDELPRTNVCGVPL